MQVSLVSVTISCFCLEVYTVPEATNLEGVSKVKILAFFKLGVP